MLIYSCNIFAWLYDHIYVVCVFLRGIFKNKRRARMTLLDPAPGEWSATRYLIGGPEEMFAVDGD